ncbi:MAG TPA: cyanophycin synthetase, partial [Patescibacteria group bacterium]|nr:cyanophycin synthetase [Patescibacteria group bacterium]
FRVGKTTCVDDTYSANTDGVIAALTSLGRYHGKRILILHPLIELGDVSEEVHERLGAAASEVCDLIIMTNDSFVESVSKGVQMRNKGVPVVIKRGKEAYLYLEETFSDKKTILFEGREARSVLQYYG